MFINRNFFILYIFAELNELEKEQGENVSWMSAFRKIGHVQ